MRRFYAVLGIVLACFLCLAAPAQARFFGVQCQQNQLLQVDPIAQPGVFPSDHLHAFACAKGVTQNSTVATMEASGTSAVAGFFAPGGSTHIAWSAARVADDTAGQWIPAMYVNGVARTPLRFVDYWSNTSISGRAFTNMPEGLQLVAGDHSATTAQPMSVLYWNCGADFTSTWPSSTVPPVCPSNHTLQAHLEFPVCWDGVGLTRFDVTNPGAPAFTEAPKFNACPAAFPVQLPHLQLILHTGLYGDVTKSLSFSCGNFYCLHADYWQTWKDQAFLASAEDFLRTGTLP